MEKRQLIKLLESCSGLLGVSELFQVKKKKKAPSKKSDYKVGDTFPRRTDTWHINSRSSG